MALKKKIQKPNGLTLEYHRIAMVKIDTNLQCTMLVYSYLDESSRLKEKEVLKVGIDKGEPLPYVESEYMSLEYDENMSIKNAYEWLKKQPAFADAVDVFEDATSIDSNNNVERIMEE